MRTTMSCQWLTWVPGPRQMFEDQRVQQRITSLPKTHREGSLLLKRWSRIMKDVGRVSSVHLSHSGPCITGPCVVPNLALNLLQPCSQVGVDHKPFQHNLYVSEKTTRKTNRTGLNFVVMFEVCVTNPFKVSMLET